MSPVRRLLVCSLVALGALGATAGPALAHATLIGATPAPKGHGVSTEAKSVTLRFSESVQILNKSDVTVINNVNRREVDTGQPRVQAGDSHLVIVPLHGPLLPDSYSVRYRVVSNDSHSTGGAFVFGVGNARLTAPILAGTGGLKDTSPVSVAARVVELVALGLLLGVIAFRMLVWGPAVARSGELEAGEGEAALRHGQRLFWRSFWGLAVLAGVAETLVLVAKSAVVFHTDLAGAALNPSSTLRLVAASRFGDILGWRSAALLLLVGVAFLVWSAESAQAPSAGRRGPLALMGLLGVAALTLLASQGHASQAPLAPLSVAADAMHLGAAAIWVGGLPCLIVVLLRAPRALPDSGRMLASATLRRFSKIALWAVVVVSVTGLARMAGELSSPVELLSTGYGRDLMLKASLLLPMLLLARRNRQFVAALAGGVTPTAARLQAVARTVRMELAIAGGIITLAALLVAQVPGRV